ncbi:helix-turn-helix protein [Lentzea atacamensis]|uniref:Helix-turn-helix protein n=1 Tax=Lentzea atacamensis TaxID=531938 RepID=A0ABX9E7H0_9PSEU|nr:helix-turn-helix transcriptional regulator [Lentzea atacamensis]RAS65641.1 helix-turn-helix protein [Lentzea atacamensis]
MNGADLRTARVAAGVSLSEMSRRTHFSKAYLGHLETGKRSIGPEHIRAYEQALNVSLSHERHSVGVTDVELLSQAVNVVTALGLRHGGMAIADMARSHWGWTEGLLNQSMPDNVRKGLSWQAARLANRLGWSLSEAGRKTQATTAYTTALDLSKHDHGLHAAVSVDLAKHKVGMGHPQEALTLLDSLSPKEPVHQFTANGVASLAAATLGDWQGTVRYVGLADEAWSRVELSNLPEVNRPYVSGHEAHAHRDAGRAFHVLALKGEKRAVPLAGQRLELAVSMFGPDRANAVSQCRKRLDSLATL